MHAHAQYTHTRTRRAHTHTHTHARTNKQTNERTNERKMSDFSLNSRGEEIGMISHIEEITQQEFESRPRCVDWMNRFALQRVGEMGSERENSDLSQSRSMTMTRCSGCYLGHISAKASCVRTTNTQGAHANKGTAEREHAHTWHSHPQSRARTNGRYAHTSPHIQDRVWRQCRPPPRRHSIGFDSCHGH